MAKKDITKLQEYRQEYTDWLSKLQPYHVNRFDANYKQYTAYTQTQGTKTKISDPVIPELVERIIQKLFEREPKFFALAKGENVPREITNVMSGIAEYFWTNPELVQSTGTMRSKMKMAGREFCVLGNVVVEAFYNSKIDMPDLRIVPLEDVIFDPSKTLKTSDVKYIRNFVDMDYIEGNVEVSEGGEVVSGIFNPKAVKQLKLALGDSKDQPENITNKINRSGSDLYTKHTGNIELISRWTKDGKLCRFLAHEELDHIPALQEMTSFIKEDPFAIAMDIEVPKEPYAFSFVDSLNGLVHAKDLLLNQVVDYGSKALNPPLFVDPSLATVNRRTLSNAYKVGGIVFANPALAKHQTMDPLPPTAFDLMNYIQQRAESTSGISAYLGGMTSSPTDKTQGTKGGIQSLIEQSASPVRDRQLSIEESLIEPTINKWLKMAGQLISENEVKYALISGENSKWVALTQGLLTGKVTLADLYDAGVVEDDEAAMSASALYENGKDPDTTVLLDVDWVIKVEAGSLAEQDTEKEIEAFNNWVEKSIGMGVQLDMKKVSKELALKAGIKEPEQYLMDETQMAQTPEAPPIEGMTDPMQQMGGQPQQGQPMPQQMQPNNMMKG